MDSEPQEGFASADRIFEDVFSTAPVAAIPLELLVSVASTEASGKVNIWSATGGLRNRSALERMIEDDRPRWRQYRDETAPRR